jgi:uncharacterized protein (DUF433 family)
VNHIEIVDGRAVIAGTHIKADLVANLYVNGGASIEEVMDQYNLSQAQVHSALAYYYDNREAIERGFEEAEALARQIAIPSDELLARLRAQKQNKGES